MYVFYQKKKNVQQKFEGTMFGPIRDPIMCRKTYRWSVILDYITQPVRLKEDVKERSLQEVSI